MVIFIYIILFTRRILPCILKKERFETNAYFSSVAVPTTKSEARMLQNLKYGIISDKAELCNWHPEWLGEDLAIWYANQLGYSNVSFFDTEEYMEYDDQDGDTYKITATPSNLECIIAGYRMIGRHRKVAMILKKIKQLGIEHTVFNMKPGRQA